MANAWDSFKRYVDTNHAKAEAHRQRYDQGKTPRPERPLLGDAPPARNLYRGMVFDAPAEPEEPDMDDDDAR